MTIAIVVTMITMATKKLPKVQADPARSAM
jgi:hypothetical protein